MTTKTTIKVSQLKHTTDTEFYLEVDGHPVDYVFWARENTAKNIEFWLNVWMKRAGFVTPVLFTCQDGATIRLADTGHGAIFAKIFDGADNVEVEIDRATAEYIQTTIRGIYA